MRFSMTSFMSSSLCIMGVCLLDAAVVAEEGCVSEDQVERMEEETAMAMRVELLQASVQPKNSAVGADKFPDWGNIANSIGSDLGAAAGAVAKDLTAETLALALNASLDKLQIVVDNFVGTCHQQSDNLETAVNSSVKDRLPRFEANVQSALQSVGIALDAAVGGLRVASKASKEALLLAHLDDAADDVGSALEDASARLETFKAAVDGAHENFANANNKSLKVANSAFDEATETLNSTLSELDSFAEDFDQSFFTMVDECLKTFGASPEVDNAFQLIRQKAVALMGTIPDGARQIVMSVEHTGIEAGLKRKTKEDDSGHGIVHKVKQAVQSIVHR